MQMITLPQKAKYIPTDENSGVFEIDGCYPGYGATIGNAMRRVLLSSLSGAAITSVKIKGVKHEFSTIPNVVEDVIQIILNLKQVRFKLHTDEAVKVSLKAKGEKKITAGMIETSSDIEVVNKDATIASISGSKGELEMEMEISKGIGYVPVEQQDRDKKEVGVIAVDAIYTPVRKVNYVISNMRVGKRTDFEKISLEVKTDGSISPKEAFQKAVSILIDQFSILSEFKGDEAEEVQDDRDEIEAEEKAEKAKDKKERENKEEEKEENSKEIEISELKNLSTRTLNVLEKSNIAKVKDILKLTEEEIAGLPGMGAKGIKEIRKAIGDFGFTLKK
jgi:DNA-directed RNA polymerase subunit alpha